MSEAPTLEYIDYESQSTEHPHLEIVDTQPERPPKLTAEEAEFLLEQGPYTARLRASRRILSITMAYARDEQTASFIEDDYLIGLQADVKTRQSELRKFNTAAVKNKSNPPEATAEVIDQKREHPRLTVVPVIGEMAVTSTVRRDIEGRDSVNLYLESISRVPLLTAELEVELSKTIEAALLARSIISGNSENTLSATEDELMWLAEQGDQAYSRFIESNLRLVVSIARKYGRSQMPMLDLIQEGNTGLIRAVEKFDYTKGYKFSTYATWWVRQSITRGIAQQARIVRLPVHVVEEVNQIGSARRTLDKTLGREAEPEEIALELGMDVDRVMDLLTWSKDHISLDAPVGDDGETTLGDFMARDTAPGPDAELEVTETNQALEELIQTLDERSGDIIRRRYGLVDGRQEKLADIGQRHGISAERVRQLEREALQRLRLTGDPNL